MNRKLAAGAQHPPQLPQCPRLVVDPAQHQCGHGHVEGVVVERKVPGRRAQDLAGRAVHAAARSRRRSIGGCASVSVSDVIAGPKQGRPVPGPAADLEHATAQPGEHALPEGAQPRPDDSTNDYSASRHS
jgi:hypothetical protein